MAQPDEISVSLPTETAERAAVLARQQGCSVAQLLRESLDRYEAVTALVAAIQSGGYRVEALDAFIQDYVDRAIHEHRAEQRAAGRKERDERIAS
jgi:predicted DNA-binding protein